MGYTSLNVSSLVFRYEDNPQTVFSNLSFSVNPGWTGVVGANGMGKSTLLKLINRELSPVFGSISGPGERFLCEQRTTSPPGRMAEFFNGVIEGESTAGRLYSKLGIEYEWLFRWDTLSYGERKRLQIACALFNEPEILLLDEPVNHLDEEAVDILITSLRGFRGIGLVVSHDRHFMNALCSSSLFIQGGSGVLRPGSLDDGMARAALEEQTLRYEYEKNRRHIQKLKKEAIRRRQEAEKHKKDFSKKGLAWKDSDSRHKIDGMRLAGKDALGNRLVKRMDERIRREEAGIADKRAGLRKKGLSISSTDSSGDFLFRIEGGNLPLGDSRLLTLPDLSMRPGERVAVTGGNGAGKSTLINYICSGFDLPPRSVFMLPQEFSLDYSAGLYEEFHDLNKSDKSAVLSRFYRLNGEPDALLSSRLPSPGELRKLAMAMGLNTELGLVVLDEPANHLDLPSLKALEDALAESSVGILLVSHDRIFRKTLTNVEWNIMSSGELRILYLDSLF